MKQYFRNMKYNTKYIFESIIERDFSEAKYWFRKFFDDCIFSPLRQIKYGIENLIDWFPIIWNDRDWDHYFIEVMLRKKLKDSSDSIRKYHSHLEWEDTVKSLDFCVRRLDEILEDDYRSTLMKKHDLRWGELKTESVPCDLDKNGKPLTYQMLFNRDNASTEELQEQERKEYRRIMHMTWNRQTRVYKLLGDCISKHMPKWWD